MNRFIEAIYQDGILQPTVTDYLKEGYTYRLKIIAEIVPVDNAAREKLAHDLEERTTVLSNGQSIVNLLGLFEGSEADLSFEAIEATLAESRHEQAREWSQMNNREPM